MVTVLRANQNTFTNDLTGGTRDPQNVMDDIGPFMDALEDQSTPFLNSLTKGKAGNQRRHEWGIKGVTPRGSQVAAAVTTGATSITVVTGHGVRFQQGHVLKITKADNSAFEVVWVTDDPGPSALTVKRAIGGTPATAFATGDKIQIIGIAMPQGSDFPLAPVSRGRRFWNLYQEFSKSIAMSTYNRYTPDHENPSGDWLVEDMVQLGSDIKQDLEMSLLVGRRHNGNPDPAALEPDMMGGLEQMAELSGNVFNVGGPTYLLSVEVIEEVSIRLHEAVGENAGKLMLMSPRTKQIFNRLVNPMRYQYGLGPKDNSVDLTWDKINTEFQSYTFTHSKNLPDGTIYIYDKDMLRYMPYVNHDWKEKEVPTKGNHVWKGMSGTFTFEATGLPGLALIRNFDMNLAHYPKWGQPYIQA